MLVLRNCRLIGELTEGYNFEYGDILIHDGKIERIEAKGYQYNIAGAEELDVGNMTVLPGIIDLHVHLVYTKENPAEWKIRKAGDSIFDAYEYAKFLLSIGVTTVRDCGTDYHLSANAIRNAIDKNILVGPRIIASGVTLTPTERGNELYDDTILKEMDGVDEVRKAVRKNFEDGADFIKIMASGALMNPGGDPGMRIIEEDELKEAVKIASSRKSYVAIHAHGAEAILTGIRCGVRTIEHSSFINKEGIDLLKNRDDIGIVPTLAVLDGLMENSNTDDAFGFVVSKAQKLISNIKISLTAAYGAGVKIGWGTDTSFGSYQKKPGLEFKMRKELLDYSNIDILKQATINSAQLAGISDIVGSVKVGKKADLIVIDGSPDKDISVMYKKPVHVFRNGIKVL